jgi:hypothetical protein
MRKSAAAYLVLGLLTTPAAAGVIILSRDPSLSARAPNDAAVTHRDHNAADFRNEIQRRWPPDAP